MKSYTRDQNLHDSLYKFLEASLTQTKAQCLSELSKTINLRLIEKQEAKFDTNHGILVMSILDEGDEDQYNLRDEALVQLDYLYRNDDFLARFCRNYLFYLIGLKSDSQNQKVGFIPFKNYWANSNSPITEDQLIVSLFNGIGWRELKAGQKGRFGSFINDPTVIHHYATLTIQY